MKKNLLLLLLISILSGKLFSQASCSLVASASSSSMVCGQQVQLSAYGVGGPILMNNNFNNGTVGAGWSASSSAEFDNPCSSGLDGTTYLWMGPTTSAPRTLTTIPYNITCNGNICFDLELAPPSPGNSPCEAPDAANEGVDIAYSTDGGVTWTSIFYFDATSNLYTSWTNYCFPIPAGAISPNTMFTWTQTNSSGAGFDHWGIDNVNITLSGSCASGAPYTYSWLPTTGLSNPTIANPIATPATNTTYTVYFTNGTDTCSSILPTITVINPTADAGTMQSICLGQSVMLAGTGNSNIPPISTFSNNSGGAFSDVNPVNSQITVSGLNYTTISTSSINQVCFYLDHNYLEDVTATLISPGGTQLILAQNQPVFGFGSYGTSSTNLTCFTPSAATPLSGTTTPFVGTFAPDDFSNTFAGFNGSTANGVWTLQVTDNFFLDDGVFHNWYIVFNNPSVTTVAWSPSANMTGANTLTPTVTPTLPGLTQYTLTVNGNPGCFATDTVSIMVNQLTGVIVSANDNVLCQSDTTTIHASGGTTYAWTPATGLSSASNANPIANPAVTTNYTVTVTNGSCTKIDSVRITVNPRPNTDAIANTAHCLNDSTQLNATGANTYTWLPVTGLSASNIANPVSHNTSTITYTVTGLTTATGCFRTDSVKVTVNPLPVANAGVDTGFCAGSNVTLNATGGGTYNWLPGTNMSNSTVANPTVNPPSSLSYTLTVTNAFNCIDKDTIMVTVHALPNVDAGANGFTCLGTPRQLNATGASTYAWTPAATLSNPAISNPLANPSTSTTYTVLGTDVFGCAKSDLVTVGIYTVATITLNSSAASVCPGATATLTATGSPNSYTWTPAGTLGSTSGPSVVATPTTTTTYSVAFATPGNGCVGHDSITVSTLALPGVSVSPDAHICPGGSIAITAAGPIGVTYAWSPTDSLSSATVSSPIANPSVTTQYTVTITNGSGCSARDSVTVFAEPKPVPGSITATLTGCVSSTGSLTMQTPTVGTAPFSYSLNGGSPQSSNVFTNLSAGTYTITVSDVYTCSDTASASVSIAPNPLPGPIAATLSSCTTPSGSLTIQAPSTGAAPFIYSLNGTTTQSSNVFTNLAPGSYTITVTDANGCSASDTSSVSQPASPSLTGFTPVNAICTSATGSLTVGFPTGGSGPYTFAINGGVVQSSTVFSNLTANQYTVTVIDANGCSDSDTITVPMTPSNMVLDTATLVSTICGNTTGSINVQTPTGGTGPFVYSNNGGASYQVSTIFSNLAVGNYPVVVKDVNGCTALNSFYIGANILANAAFESSPPSGVFPLDVIFTNNSTNANGYIWTFGNGLPNSISPNSSTNYPAPGTYTVSLIAYNNVPACADTAWAVILVIEPPTLVVPNIITPNGDGKNDEFKLIGFNFKSIDVTIFDRWGKKVTSYTGDLNTVWKADGVNEGTYFYVVEAISLDDKVTKLSGYVSVMH